MRFVTTKAALLHRLMHDLALELLAIMTGETEFFRLCFQEIRLVGGMRVVTDLAVAFSCRLMHIGALQTQICLVVTKIAECGAIFLEAKHANESVWLVAGKAVLVRKRFVPELPLNLSS